MLKNTVLVRQVCEILDFALAFDGIKMMKSALQNDFSYYRRSMGKRNFDELVYAIAFVLLLSFFPDLPRCCGGGDCAFTQPFHMCNRMRIECSVDDENANLMSLFLAAPGPFMNSYRSTVQNEADRDV